MDLKERIDAFSKLGQRIQSLTEEGMFDLSQKALNKNPWFTPESVQTSLKGITKMLELNTLSKWTSKYPLNKSESKRVGIAMAGNIPLVGFHDFLSTLIAGHKAMVKLSSQDAQLLPALAGWLIEIEPRFASRISFEDTIEIRPDIPIWITRIFSSSRVISIYFALRRIALIVLPSNFILSLAGKGMRKSLRCNVTSLMEAPTITGISPRMTVSTSGSSGIVIGKPFSFSLQLP